MVNLKTKIYKKEFVGDLSEFKHLLAHICEEMNQDISDKKYIFLQKKLLENVDTLRDNDIVTVIDGDDLATFYHKEKED